MSVKRLHSRTKIFFPNPYVFRLEYPLLNSDEAMAEYIKLTRQAYKLLKGTWGYCQLQEEQVKIKDEFKHTAQLISSHFAGLSPILQIAALFNSDYQRVLRGYICFSDELDALQFRLSISTNAIQVSMWPERWFTIHEVAETE